MLCPEFEDRLNELVDQRLPVGDDLDLARHAAFCADCRALWSAYEATRQAVARLDAPAPPADLAERVVRLHLADTARRRWQYARLALAAAAALLAAVWVWRSVGPPEGPRTLPQVAAPGDGSPGPVQPTVAPPPPRPVDLAAEAHATLADAWAFAPQWDAVPAAPASGNLAATWSAPAHGLRPLSDSTADALAFLSDALLVEPPSPDAPAATDK